MGDINDLMRELGRKRGPTRSKLVGKNAAATIKLAGKNVSLFPDEMLAEIESKLNHRPRKSLGHRTSWSIVESFLFLIFEVCCISN